MSTIKHAAVIRHVGFEDLGLFAKPLQEAGYTVVYYDAGVHDLGSIDPLKPDLLIVLGGPVGVYESHLYPFLEAEIRLLQRRLDAEGPTFGICLGAQLMAKALGAEVFPSGIKEIGWAPLSITEAGGRSPLRHLEGLPVLHWHGDTFDLPHRARLLASTDICAQQAFSLGPNVMGLQFHAEVDAGLGIERWLIGHAAELAGASIDPRDLRQQTSGVPEAAVDQARAFFAEWLSHLIPGKVESDISQRLWAEPGVLLDQ
jgi:GMP synthase (glutamine-hydrolysing)